METEPVYKRKRLVEKIKRLFGAVAVVMGKLSLLDVRIQSAFIDKPDLADLDGIQFAAS